MLTNLKLQIVQLIEKSISAAYPEGSSIPNIEVEVPAGKGHGEFACNVALKSAKILKKKPLDIANELKALIEEALKQSELIDHVERIEVKPPGFINFFLNHNTILNTLNTVYEQKDSFGSSQFGKNEKIQLEFVSANPTGTLSIAHARQAAVGDAFGNILKFIGFDVTKEYYVNDEGNQINLLGESVYIRAQEILTSNLNEEALTKDHYKGEYIKDIAQEFLDANKISEASELTDELKGEMADHAVEYLMEVIKEDLIDFNVIFDVWAHQSKIADDQAIGELVNKLTQEGHMYENEGALWFKSTEYGDDKDRVIKKTDGSYTYLAPDIVYHKNKFDRGFNRIFNIWGPDHHGYIPRIKAAACALGKDHDAIDVLIVQLATIYKNGKAVSMSTRAGQYISLREVMDDVGVDVARFFFLMRHIKVHLDFDLELAKKESSENPVYYIQYAHARIHSINEKAKEASIVASESEFNLLTQDEELDLIKKIGRFNDVLLNCYQQLDPYSLTSYLHELATQFHKFYDSYKVVDSSQGDLSAQRLGLVNATKVVLANGLKLLGVSIPDRM